MGSVPAYSRKFKGEVLRYFVDATSCQPITRRLKWSEPPLPVLAESFGSIWSAAVWVAEKCAEPNPAEHCAQAWGVIQAESGLVPEVFDFAAHPWLTYFQSPALLAQAIESVPVQLREHVDRHVLWEDCTQAHVNAYQRYLQGKLKQSVVTAGVQALDAGKPHYAHTFVPISMPSTQLVDVVSCETFAHWLYERTRLQPLEVFAGPDQLLWLTRAGGPRNSNASAVLERDVSGEAWAVSLQPVFPTSRHGPTGKKPSSVPSGGRGGKAKAGQVARGQQSRRTPSTARP